MNYGVGREPALNGEHGVPRMRERVQQRARTNVICMECVFVVVNYADVNWPRV